MNKNSIYSIIILTFLWVILSERISPVTMAAGLFIGAGCVFFSGKFLPLNKITGVNFFRLAMYPLYLIGQIYLAGFQAIRLILSGSKVDIVEIKTEITNEFLEVILANSITLIPGTVSLELKDEKITVLWLRDKKSGSDDMDKADEIIKGNLERKLLKAQR